MELNEIKKALYKEKPIAKMAYTLTTELVYKTKLQDGTKIKFKIPFSDFPPAPFNDTPAQLLIRWLII